MSEKVALMGPVLAQAFVAFLVLADRGMALATFVEGPGLVAGFAARGAGA